jgi:hypothetical protein
MQMLLYLMVTSDRDLRALQKQPFCHSEESVNARQHGKFSGEPIRQAGISVPQHRHACCIRPSLALRSRQLFVRLRLRVSAGFFMICFRQLVLHVVLNYGRCLP